MVDEIGDVAGRLERGDAGPGPVVGGHDPGQQPHQRLPAPQQPHPRLIVHWSGFFGPKSWHSGGANVLFGDGRVQLLSEKMDTATIRALHSIASGEAVSYE